MVNAARLEQQLRRLRKAIQYRPPYCSGTIPVDSDDLNIFYALDGKAGCINPKTASDDHLREFSEICSPATFGVNQQDVLDETYRKAGKLDALNFAPKLDIRELLQKVNSCLLEGHDAQEPLIAELYKLNVYGPGSFFKSHKDTPRGEDMLGSLVVVYPTVHDGGALVFREGKKEWTFDSARAVAKQGNPCVAYAAFFSDVDHEVNLVGSGYRITVTYNLYFAFDNLTTSPSNETHLFRSALRKLLRDTKFLPKGGWLGFGLRHVYPIVLNKENLNYLSRRLKGSDANIQAAAQSLGLQAKLWILYVDDITQAKILCPCITQMPNIQEGFEADGHSSLAAWICACTGGKIIPEVRISEGDPERLQRTGQSDTDSSEEERSQRDSEEGSADGQDVESDRGDDDGDTGKSTGADSPQSDDDTHSAEGSSGAEESEDENENENDDDDDDDDEDNQRVGMRPVWVTPPSDLTVLQEATIFYGNEASVEYVYGHAVLMVRVGPAGNRSA